MRCPTEPPGTDMLILLRPQSRKRDRTNKPAQGSTARRVGYPGRCVPRFQGDIGVGRESSDAGRMLRIGLTGVHGVIDHVLQPAVASSNA